MKILLALLCSAALFASDPIGYSVREKSYRLSKYFDIDGEVAATVYKPTIRLMTHYYLYNEMGDYIAVGTCNPLSLGLFYDWAAEINVKDPEGNRIGYIDGQVGTSASARFQIFNAAGEKVAVAFLDNSRSGISIVDYNKQTRLIARLHRIFVDNATDHWEVKVIDNEVLDPAIIQVFAAWAVDRQAAFRKDL